ncbi:MAG: hypothetical protein IPN46_08370 [Saprospiraceae bacterium]|nr:hypothetical protein [Saprospiraceae bacterium]
MLVTSTTGNEFYIQQAASCNNTDSWLAGVPTSLQSASIPLCAAVMPRLITVTTANNACPLLLQ